MGMFSEASDPSPVAKSDYQAVRNERKEQVVSAASKSKSKLPAWVRCPACDDFICTIHKKHAHDCRCASIDTWARRGLDPYSEGGKKLKEDPGHGLPRKWRGEPVAPAPAPAQESVAKESSKKHKAALVRILAVLGRSCAQNMCQGCRHEMEEAAEIARKALQMPKVKDFPKEGGLK
jgi:predicted component of type VI protein secretion system